MNMPRHWHIDENGRECSWCGEYKPWSEYGNDKRASTGHKSRCKECEYKPDPFKMKLGGDPQKKLLYRADFDPSRQSRRRAMCINCPHEAHCKMLVQRGYPLMCEHWDRLDAMRALDVSA